MKWLLKNKKGDLDRIIEHFSFNDFIGRLLINRGFNTVEKVEAYLNPSMGNLHNARKLKGAVAGAELIKKKIQNSKSIRIIGDYDVDGIISTYVLFKGLKMCGASVDYDIPHRMEDGYGISESMIDKANKDGIDTIITCDNGISALKQIEYAKSLGLTIIVTDHHEVPYISENDKIVFTKPKADIIINPKQIDCGYPFKNICGAGVAFKFVQVLYELFGIGNEEAFKFIEFVAIATLCDVVDLVDENRIIVKYGLEKLKTTSNIGLEALFKANKLNPPEVSTYKIGFVIGPCLNASGRLDSAIKGLKLLLEDDQKKACELATELVDINDSRKDMTRKGVEKAIEIVEGSSMENDKVLVIFIKDTHESLAGIIAGRIREKYYKPTIVLTDAKVGIKGSGRSIEKYNMFKELIKCNELLGKYGGHPMAAGLALEKNNVEAFRKMINDVCTLSPDDLEPKLSLDAQLTINIISKELVNDIKKLEPFGKANPKPIFGEKAILIQQAKVIGKNQNVLKMTLESKTGVKINAIYFGEIDKFHKTLVNKYGANAVDKVYNHSCEYYLDLAFYPDINEFMGRESLQIVISEFK